ncbi:hypothetical protein, partial [Hymenobacter sp. IS2118]|uniref:hypothetical protein n=1 Tax=Hymenobacter sp. IS2118 TaxID=1505605 RepID=UPI00055455DC
ALAREQRGLRRFGRALLSRFTRHHQRRREAVLRQRFRLQLTLERYLHRQELRLTVANGQLTGHKNALGSLEKPQ